MGNQVANSTVSGASERGVEILGKIDIQNLFSYLRQEVNSPMGVIDKTKALTNVLIKKNVFNFLVKSVLKRTEDSGISLGSHVIEGYTFTGIHTSKKDEEHYSIFARNNRSFNSISMPGVVTGFLLRKEKTRNTEKNILEARLVMNNGKECTLKYDYLLTN